jgi:hypothetical protein
MARLWKMVNGEPYMVNPRLGVLALQALNPPKKRHKNMAKHYGARHMAWVRSFRKKNRHHKRHRMYRRSNPYPMGGAVAALNPRRRRHRKSNPGGFSGLMRGGLGIPPLMTIVWTGLGFVGTAMIQGFIDTLIPISWKTNTDGTPNLLTKYGEIAASIVAVSYGGKLLGGGKSTLFGIGGGVYMAQQAAHDFFPNVIPGMHAYTPLNAYTPLLPSGLSGMRGMRGIVGSSGGAFPQLASRASMPRLAAPDQGFRNSANFADDGAMQVVAERFRRF